MDARGREVFAARMSVCERGASWLGVSGYCTLVLYTTQRVQYRQVCTYCTLSGIVQCCICCMVEIQVQYKERGEEMLD